MCALLSSLIEPIHLVEPHRAHLNIDWDKYHNYNQKDSPIDQYPKHTELYQSAEQLQAGADFFRTTVKFGTEFNKMPDPEMFILGCHAYNPESMLRAWPSSRVINITFGPNDLDQISYNWVTKNVIQDSRPDDLRQLVKFLHSQWPRHLRPITEADINWEDIRNMSFITRWINTQTASRFNAVSQRMADRDCVLNISFSDIATGRLTQQLDRIVDFCGIQVSQERLDNAERLIRQYSAAQTPVPWSLDNDCAQSLGF